MKRVRINGYPYEVPDAVTYEAIVKLALNGRDDVRPRVRYESADASAELLPGQSLEVADDTAFNILIVSPHA